MVGLTAAAYHDPPGQGVVGEELHRGICYVTQVNMESGGYRHSETGPVHGNVTSFSRLSPWPGRLPGSPECDDLVVNRLLYQSDLAALHPCPAQSPESGLRSASLGQCLPDHGV